MTKSIKIINDYWLKEIFLNSNPDLKNFYKDNLIRMIQIAKREINELKKENQNQKEQIEYLRRSIERKEEQIIDLQHERVPMVDEEKQELIDYLKKEKKEQEHKKDTSHCGLDIVYANGQIKSYKEILSKIEKR